MPPKAEHEHNELSGISVDILSGEKAYAAWSAFEKVAVLTPYQQSDWIRGLDRARGDDEDALDLLTISRDGQMLACLPLRIVEYPFCRMAKIPGTSISNIDWIPQRADVTISRDMLLHAFSVFSKRRNVDFIRFSNLPRAWQGIENPLLVFPHSDAPDNLYMGPIEAVLPASLSKRRRGDFLRSIRRLEELIGPVNLKRATKEAEIRAVHAAFIDQRNIRFQEMGIKNIFAEPYFMRFFHDLGVASINNGTATLRLDALYAGDEILATAIGAQSDTHYSQYINSNTEGPASKYSLVGLLTFLLVEKLAEKGVKTLDMGVGDYTYKKVWAEKTPVFDLVLPLSFKGRIIAPAIRTVRCGKRLIKQNPALWELYKKVRGLKLLLKR